MAGGEQLVSRANDNHLAGQASDTPVQREARQSIHHSTSLFHAEGRGGREGGRLKVEEGGEGGVCEEPVMTGQGGRVKERQRKEWKERE